MDVISINLAGGIVILIMLHKTEKFLEKSLTINSSDARTDMLLLMMTSVLSLLWAWCFLSLLMVVASVSMGDISYTLRALVQLVQSHGVKALLADDNDFKALSIDYVRYSAGLATMGVGCMGYYGALSLIHIRKLRKALFMKDPK